MSNKTSILTGTINDLLIFVRKNGNLVFEEKLELLTFAELKKVCKNIDVVAGKIEVLFDIAIIYIYIMEYIS